MAYEAVHGVREWVRRGAGFVKHLGEIIAMRGLVASTDEQQIPIRLRSGQALHCASLRSE